jgi:hypothetical protein
MNIIRHSPQNIRHPFGRRYATEIILELIQAFKRLATFIRSLRDPASMSGSTPISSNHPARSHASASMLIHDSGRD